MFDICDEGQVSQDACAVREMYSINWIRQRHRIIRLVHELTCITGDIVHNH